MSKTFTDTVPTHMEDKVKGAYLAIWPNTDTIDDPDYDGDETPPQIPKYPNDWVWIAYKLKLNNRQIYHNGLQIVNNRDVVLDEPFEE